MSHRVQPLGLGRIVSGPGVSRHVVGSCRHLQNVYCAQGAQVAYRDLIDGCHFGEGSRPFQVACELDLLGIVAMTEPYSPDTQDSQPGILAEVRQSGAVYAAIRYAVWVRQSTINGRSRKC
jgi:hypothetical protein